MRALIRAAYHSRSISRCSQVGASHGCISRVGRSVVKSQVSSVFLTPCSPFREKEIGVGLQYDITSRTLQSSAAKDSGKDAERGGPLVEYERRIAAGELMAGDKCQEETLRALQRLYDELVDAAEICGLERSSSSNKSNRSWFSFMVPQASLSPVRGLYLYGGVGTCKTMLMDMLYEQLPMADLKLRQKYA